MNRTTELLKLRRFVRKVIRETRKVSPGWENYAQGRDVDNSAIDAGYDAHYMQQYADVTRDLYHVDEIDAGGHNVITRRRNARKK